MARLVLVPQEMPGSYPSLPLVADSIDLAFVASGADYIDGFSLPLTGREMLIIRNDNVAAKTVTLDSLVSKRTNREGDITAYSIGIGEYVALGPFSSDGWKQTDGTLHGAVNAADLMLLVLKW